jgi:sugar transferase (PEP-CTERM/EpsH1 system associated)
MANVLYLVHRMPYPPNKGDKVRSYHILEHLRARHQVYLGTFIDDPEDEPHLDALRSRCADLHVARLRPARSRVNSLGGLIGGRALTIDYYRDAGLRRWIAQTVARTRIDAVVVFSSAMAQYAEGLPVPMIVDFVDVDSAKWSEYALHHRWPMSWLYRRESQHLLAHERQVAHRAVRSFFVTDKETDLFRRLAPDCAELVEAIGNGVDAQAFAPEPSRTSPYPDGEQALVFTGAMDYWPNIDAVTWFAQDVMPLLRRSWPQARFHIVGRNPAPAVRALAGPDVLVSGTVPDVRPYLQHAGVVVAPLRLARGIQNKVLEAMAMARPVVASVNCAEPIDATPGQHLLTASTAAEFAARIDDLLRNPARANEIGAAGRQCVFDGYSWAAQLAPLDRLFDMATRRQAQAA